MPAAMAWLNYHHFLYFWVVAREGSIARASIELRLAEPTISGQIRRLEESLGERLFTRSGRHLVLSDVGQVAYRYADEIFSLGREFTEGLKGRAGSTKPLRLTIGIADVLPKTLVGRLLEPAFELGLPFRLVCREDKTVEEFIGELAVHAIDLVLADSPAPPTPVKVFSHRLGECGTTIFGVAALARPRRKTFPRSLADAPLLLPTSRSALRRALDQWMYAHEIRPRIVAELDDSALSNALGSGRKGLFIGPSLMEREICRQYRVEVVGRLPDVRQNLYAISVERRLKHPAVLAICETARADLFG
jgi:LysR family transcriptional activator of nhaA